MPSKRCDILLLYLHDFYLKMLISHCVCVCTCNTRTLRLDSELSVDERKQRDSEERETLVVWKKPQLTLHYFTLELLITLKEWLWR